MVRVSIAFIEREKDRYLRIADLLAHRSALHIRSQFAGDVAPSGFGAEIVQLLIGRKYNRSYAGIIDGYGTKWLP